LGYNDELSLTYVMETTSELQFHQQEAPYDSTTHEKLRNVSERDIKHPTYPRSLRTTLKVSMWLTCPSLTPSHTFQELRTWTTTEMPWRFCRLRDRPVPAWTLGPLFLAVPLKTMLGAAKLLKKTYEQAKFKESPLLPRLKLGNLN
jgi:hypothetical protein